MDYHEEFDGAICMDAMESVFPEDWPLVTSNLYRAIRPGGYLYFTVETIGEEELAEAFVDGQRLGAPVVYGEYAPEGGYHYYPRIHQVKEWTEAAGFRLVDDMTGEDYHHFLVQKPG